MPIERAALLPEDHTQLARKIIKALATENPDLKTIRSDISAIQRFVLDEQIDPDDEKKRVQDMAETVQKHTDAAVLKLLRGREGARGAFLGMVMEYAEMGLLHCLVNERGIEVDAAAKFIVSKPLLLRHSLLRMRQASKWVVESGLSSADPLRILNDRFDQEYVAIGSYFEETLTRDKGSNAAVSDLRLLVDDVARGRLTRAYRDLKKYAAERASKN